MKKGWTTTKLASIGGLAVLDVALKLVGAGFQAATGLVGLGGITNGFLTPAMVMFCLLTINQFGAATIMLTLHGILVLPLPISGTPGFLGKVPIQFVGGLLADILYLFLRKNKKRASLIIGGVLMLYLGFAIVQAGQFFKIPGIEWTAKMFYTPPVLALAVIVGAIGGYLGFYIYEKIKNTSVVKRIQQ